MTLFTRILALTLIFVSSWTLAAPRTVFVQLFEWPWNDVARECEIYLGPMGFAAVQVSPPQEHIKWQQHPWWERYQVASYKIDSRGGNQDEFIDMIRRCKNAGVDVYADTVINHMTGIPGGEGFAGTKFSHYNYPGLYSYNDFHHCGRNGNDDIANYSDRYEVQNCELLDLADLATESDYVRDQIAKYLNHLLDLGVAGFRIDAAKHIPASDLSAIYSRLNGNPYIYHEVIYDPSGPIQYEEYLPHGDVFAYDYSQLVGQGFLQKDTSKLSGLAQNFPSTDQSIVSITNHDLERTNNPNILSYNGDEQRLYRLSQVFMLAWPFGYPQLYSGYEFNSFDQGPPLAEDLRSLPVLDQNAKCMAPFTCEHRLAEVAAMVDFRNQTDRAFYVTNWWTNSSDQLSFGRGNLGHVIINYSDKDLTRTFKTSMAPGQYCNIVGSGYNPVKKTCNEAFVVNKNGQLTTRLPPMTAVVLLKTSPFRAKK